MIRSPAGGAAGLLALLGFSLQLSACSSPDESPLPGAQVDVWLTNPDQSALLSEQASLVMEPAAGDAADIVIDPGRRFQEIVGFGASITDATVILFDQALSEDNRKALMNELFGPAPGLKLSMLRIPIGASDFSTKHYSFNDRPAGGRDVELAGFALPAVTEQALALIREAHAINPEITVMATPWSPPAWMKSSNSLITGTLNPGDYDVFGRYLLRSVQAFGEQGVDVDLISIQNEPDYEPADYPGMRLSDSQRAEIIGSHVGPLFEQSGLNVQILEWDHNWDKPEAPLAVLSDPKASTYVSGVAWHCYAGDVAAQATVRDAHPDKDVYFTECTGGDWDPGWESSFPWVMRNIIIGATRNWARGIIFWNLALDEAHGPHLGGCANCRGVLTIDGRSGLVTRNIEYYALAHVSRFVRPGASRISSSSTDLRIETVAFQNADDGSMVLVALNNGDSVVSAVFRHAESQFRYSLPARSAATFVWL